MQPWFVIGTVTIAYILSLVFLFAIINYSFSFPKASKMKDKKGNVNHDKSNVRELKPWPQFISDRLKLWDKLKAQYDEELAAKEQFPIKVVLPDGKEVEATAWKSTAFDIAKGIRLVSATLIEMN